MKQAVMAEKDDPVITEIVLKLLTFKPEKDAVRKTIVELVALSYKNHYTRKFGI